MISSDVTTTNLSSDKPTMPQTHACHHDTGAVTEDVIESRVALAKASCVEKGVRFTPLREQIYRFILQANKPIGAYDLLAQLQALSDKPVAPPTVYRSLDFLLEYGFIHQLNSTKAFFACCEPDAQHVAAFFICQCCGDVQEFSHSPLYTVLNQVAETADFTIHSSVIEISGLCQRCRITP